MRCLACNKRLNDFENTRRYADPKLGYVQLCEADFKPIQEEVSVQERDDLRYQLGDEE